jgi:hypothetical protein
LQKQSNYEQNVRRIALVGSSPYHRYRCGGSVQTRLLLQQTQSSVNIYEAVENLTTRGIKVNIAFDESSIQKFLLWGVLAAVVAGSITAIIRKQIA